MGEKWVINALCDGSVMLSTGREGASPRFPASAQFPTALRCLLYGRQEANGIFLSTYALYLVLLEQRRGLLHRWVLKSIPLYTTGKCALNHTMCLFVSRTMRVRLEELDPRCGTFRDIKELCSSVCVSFSFSMFQCLFPLPKYCFTVHKALCEITGACNL